MGENRDRPRSPALIAEQMQWLKQVVERSRTGLGVSQQAVIDVGNCALQFMPELLSALVAHSKSDAALAAAEAKGRAAAIEEAAKVADDWLQTFGAREPKHVSAQTWACDAVRDISEAIRSLAHPKETTDVTG